MAGRSDFNAVFPRQLKKLWASTKFDNAHDAGEWKRIMIQAHARHKAVKNTKRMMQGPAITESDVADTVS